MSRYGQTEYEIDTLIHGNIAGSFGSRALDIFRRFFGPAALPTEELKSQEEEGSVFEHGQLPSKYKVPVLPILRDIVVTDENLSAEYEVHGIRQDEIPVIGTFVDKRILPGFRYQVRILGTDQYLFEGKALPLLSVGMGYGKRITFEGHTHNSNTNYFYSDTQPAGFGFKLVTILPQDKFMVDNFDLHTIGEGTFDEVTDQRELSTEVEADGTIVKRVRVDFTCDINYSAGHGLLPLQSNDSFKFNAVAVVVKPHGSRKAHTKCIEQVEIPSCGPCTFEIINPKVQITR